MMLKNLLTKLDKAIEKFDKKYKEDYPKATYKYEAVSYRQQFILKKAKTRL